MQKLPERASSSPSGSHVGLYKALHVCMPSEEEDYYNRSSMQEDLVRMFLNILNSCLCQGFVLPRWRIGTNIMLQKKQGNFSID